MSRVFEKVAAVSSGEQASESFFSSGERFSSHSMDSLRRSRSAWISFEDFRCPCFPTWRDAARTRRRGRPGYDEAPRRFHSTASGSPDVAGGGKLFDQFRTILRDESVEPVAGEIPEVIATGVATGAEEAADHSPFCFVLQHGLTVDFAWVPLLLKNSLNGLGSRNARSGVVVVDFFGAVCKFHDPPVWKRGIEVNAGFCQTASATARGMIGVSSSMRRVWVRRGGRTRTSESRSQMRAIV